MIMTADALVKAILTEESCELFDKIRINNLFKNITKGYGKLLVLDEHVSITYTGSKSKKVVYLIPKEILTTEQLSII